MSSLIDDQAKRRCLGPVPQLQIGLRVGEASNPGPAERYTEEIFSELEAALTMADSSDEEQLVRPVSDRNVVWRVGTPPPVVVTALTVADTEEESGFVVQRSRRRGGLVMSTPATVPLVQANRFSPLVGEVESRTARPGPLGRLRRHASSSPVRYPTCLIRSYLGGQSESLMKVLMCSR